MSASFSVPSDVSRQRRIPIEFVCYVIAAIAVVACFVLYGKVASLGASSADHEQNVATLLQEIKRQETAWSDAVLIASFGYAETYDPANAALRRLLDNTHTLQANIDANGRLRHSGLAGDAHGSQLLQRYLTALQQKRAFAEHMKSAHAVIGNSAAYLPTLERSMDLSANASPDAHARNTASPEADMRALAVGLAAYLANPSPDLARGLRASIATLGTADSTQPGKQDITVFAQHATVVLRNVEALHSAVKAFSSVPTNDTLDALTAYADQQQTSAAHTAQALNMVLLLLAVLGCWMLVTAIRHSLQRYRSISDKNIELQLSKEAVEMQLIQAAKMSAIGQLVAGVVHEINTPLAYVKATFEVLRDQMLMDPDLLKVAADTAAKSIKPHASMSTAPAKGGVIPVGGGSETATDTAQQEAEARQAYLADIEMLFVDGAHGIEQISSLVLSLKNFSRIDHAKTSHFAVEDGLKSALVIAKHEIKYVADVETDFQSTPQITGSPSHINQVFLNIIMNACQAMAGMGRKGVLRIATRRTEANEVQVTISDTGPGIPPDVLPRIFDPYFTTKPADEGTGTGLAICQRIIQHHRGRIEAHSRPGVETRFVIHLPVRPPIDVQAMT